MKQVLVLVALLAGVSVSHAQLIKRVGRSIKDNAENRVVQKSTNTFDKAIDSIGKKKSKKEKKPEADSRVPDAVPGINAATPAETGGQQQSGEGFIEMELSEQTVFFSGILTISGESGTHKNLNKVDVAIIGKGVNQVYTVALDKDGKFKVQWNVTVEPGSYKATCTSSDKKATTEMAFTVEALEEMNVMADENAEVIEEAITELKKKVADTKGDLSSKHGAELDKRLNEAERKAGKLKAFFTGISKAGDMIRQEAKKGNVLPKNAAEHISQLHSALEEHKSSTKKILEDVRHETNAYTICETLEMVNEACAAFSTITNFMGSYTKVLKNLAMDKALPATLNALNERTLKKYQPNEAILPALTKQLINAKVNVDDLPTDGGKAGMMSDMTQLVGTVLLKEYCGSFEGSLTQEFKVFNRNSSGQPWWTYGYTTAATVTLRYPKKKGNGKVVQMKGHIEGNATSFNFFQDMTKEDEYMRISKGRAPLIQLKVVRPIALPFVAAEVDSKLGFGMLARAAATPSYFNIPVDATYDRDAGTIRLFVTEGGINFSPLVKYKVLFVMPLVAPIFKVEEFPVLKAKETINSVIKRYGEYKVIDDKKGGLSFKGTDTHHVGTPTSELELSSKVTIEAKQ